MSFGQDDDGAWVNDIAVCDLKWIDFIGQSACALVFYEDISCLFHSSFFFSFGFLPAGVGGGWPPRDDNPWAETRDGGRGQLAAHWWCVCVVRSVLTTVVLTTVVDF